MPYLDQEFGEELDRLFSEKFDLLLGRKTCEIFAACWSYYDQDAPHGGIFTIPAVLGDGKKPFADGSAPHAYTLTRSRVSSTGTMIGHCERDGEIKIGGTALDAPSEREIARQERMKREG